MSKLSQIIYRDFMMLSTYTTRVAGWESGGGGGGAEGTCHTQLLANSLRARTKGIVYCCSQHTRQTPFFPGRLCKECARDAEINHSGIW